MPSRAPVLMLAVAVLAAGHGAVRPAAQRLPNFIIVYADDLGYADIGPFSDLPHGEASGHAASRSDGGRGRPAHQLLRRPGGVLGVARGAAHRVVFQPRQHQRALNHTASTASTRTRRRSPRS